VVERRRLGIGRCRLAVVERRRLGSPAILPRRPRGRLSEEAHRVQLKRFCGLIKQIASTMDFKVGSRGWCYILENYGLRKGDFDAAQRLITACRKSGDLPLDICAEDESRETIGLEDLDQNDISAEVESWVDHLRNGAHLSYMPISFWDDLDVYIEVGVEKLDLRNLFEPTREELHVPLTNFKGWSDLNSRVAMMRRFVHWEAKGKKCILLLCGDHDPGGLRITARMRKNMEDLGKAVGRSPDNLVIIRFGLNADFINLHGLTWIDLETSSGGQLDDPDHEDHDKSYVQDYIGGSFTIPEWSRHRRISISMYYKLRAQGKGPTTLDVGRHQTITAEADAAWVRERQAASLLPALSTGSIAMKE
jgi:hypothetical protein